MTSFHSLHNDLLILAPSLAFRKMEFAPTIFLCAAFAVVASSAMVIGQYIVEAGGYHLFLFLEKRGLIHRFAPHIPVKLTQFTLRNAWAVGGSHLPLFFVLCLFRRGFLARATPSFDPLHVWSFVWVTMVLHDAWFFWLHTCMHWSKPVYKPLHQFHHQSTSDLNTFGTSYAEAAEFLFDWSLFYGCNTCFLYTLPSWNPVALLLTFVPVSLVNIMGHSGYDLPPWVYLPLSFGILATPWSQRSRNHFIHHIDPRYNRSLYFTWWDRMAGTFRDEHRLTSGKGLVEKVAADKQ